VTLAQILLRARLAAGCDVVAGSRLLGKRIAA
jgi:hypothetical protein